MELSPQAISSMEFELVRRGYDPEQVREFLSRLAAAVEEMRSHLLASDARARAAMARVQELSSSAAAVPSPAQSNDSEAISKVLVLAQKAADQTVADADERAAAILAEAGERAQAITAKAQDSLSDAQLQADEIVRRTEVATRSKMEAELQTLADKRAMLQNEADILRGQIAEMRDHVGDVIEDLQRVLRAPRRSFAVATDAAPATSAAPAELNGQPGESGFVAKAVESFDAPVGYAAEFAEPDLAPVNLAPPPMPTLAASTATFGDDDFASIADMWSQPE
jgi:DivIVA domain-containing protein